MKITIRCDEGHIVWEGTGYKDIEHIKRRFDMFPVNVPECEVCTKPTYGPITVEMVAEALCDACDVSEWTDFVDEHHGAEYGADDFRDMASFVIRLLNDAPGLLAQSALMDIDWPHRLLKMARG